MGHGRHCRLVSAEPPTPIRTTALVHRCRAQGDCPEPTGRSQRWSSILQTGHRSGDRLSLLPQFAANVTPEMIKAYLSAVAMTTPLVRAAAVDALEPFAPAERLQVAERLSDRPRARRADRGGTHPRAGSEPSCCRQNSRPPSTRHRRNSSTRRWPSAERPEAHVTLGAFYADRGLPADAPKLPTGPPCGWTPGSCRP